MRLRKYIITAATAAALAAGGVTWAVTATAGNPIDATPVQATITLTHDENPPTLAPPPADAAPKLTARQAVDAYTGKTDFQIPDGTTVQLGLLTVPVGDASVCDSPGEDCSGYTIDQSTVYRVLGDLVYSFSESRCPEGTPQDPASCVQYTFLDANTGKWVVDIGPGGTPGSVASDSPTPSTSPQG
jgi:hypothetical protein